MGSSLGRIAVLVLLLGVGCAGRQPKPIVVSSAPGTAYALGYPAQLEAEAGVLVADKKQTNELLNQLRAGRQLKPGADQAVVLAIVAQADEAGRGAEFATANAQTRAIRTFWEEERGPITGRVNGVAEKQLTEAGCKTDVSAGIGYALKDSIERQLERRLRARNEAQRTIELNKAALGQANVTPLQTLADEIAMTSYLANSGLVADRDRLEQLLADQGEADTTLGEALERERALQAPTTVSAAERKASQERAAELEQARRAIPPAVSKARAALENIDVQIENARELYQQALDTLTNQLRTQTTPPAH